jgi:aspartate aminotransferase
MELSERIKSVGASPTIAVTKRAAQMKADGIDVISFGAGEPDFDTPAYIKDAAKAALDAGDTKYTPKAGAKLRAALADKLKRENALDYTPEQILVTFGGKHALFNAFQVLVNPGDKVLIPTPYWVSYPEQVKLADGECVYIPTGPEKGFKITPADVLKYGQGAKILILNSPNNPTSVTYTPAEMQALAEAVLKTDLIVFTDEIYEKLIYGDTKFVSFAALDPKLPARTVTFNGVAKCFSMPGWRIGWAAGPLNVIKAMTNLQSHQTTDPVSFCQAATLTAYTAPCAAAEIEKMRVEFEKRGRHMWQRLNALDGVTCVQPTGAFYCFPDVSAHYGRTFGKTKATDSLTFAAAALEEAKVALVPGVAFGEDKCVRLSFATGMKNIDAGIDRLAAMLKK